MHDKIYYNDKISTIYSLFGFLKPTLCYIYAPTSPMYNHIVSKFHFTIQHINLYTDIDTQLEENSLVIFSNPNDIDGQYYDIEKLIEIWINKNITIIIDESFLKFTVQQSMKKYLIEYKNIYIISSIKYFYSKYNSDITFLLSSISNIDKINNNEKITPLSNCNKTILKSIKEDKSYDKVQRVLNITKKEKVYRVLELDQNIQNIFDSSTNQILVESTKQVNKSTFYNIDNTKEVKFLDTSYRIISLVY